MTGGATLDFDIGNETVTYTNGSRGDPSGADLAAAIETDMTQLQPVECFNLLSRMDGCCILKITQDAVASAAPIDPITATPSTASIIGTYDVLNWITVRPLM